MPTIRMTIDKLPGAIEELQADMKRAIVKGVRSGAHRGQAFIVRKTPTDQGQLKNSWEVVTTISDGALGELCELINTAPHAGIVELGARPHPVSEEGFEAIRQWVFRHRAEFGMVTASGRARSRKAKDVEKMVERITWGIVMKIRKYGQDPTYFVRKNLGELRKIVQLEVEKAVSRVLRQGGF